MIGGSLIGLVAGGFLAVVHWRLVFLVSVPVGIAGTIWAYLKLQEAGVINKERGLDILGNSTFGAGLTVLLVALTYSLLPYGHSVMGWANPLSSHWHRGGVAPADRLCLHRTAGQGPDVPPEPVPDSHVYDR